DKMNIAWGDVRPAQDVEGLASVQARNSIAQVDDRAGGVRPIPQSPYRFTNAQANVQGGAPHLGEHNQDVLSSWLGMSVEDAAQWQDVLVQKLPD
ncbi:MAG: CoA transferase, partial [Pseudomonadota bacterium]